MFISKSEKQILSKLYLLKSMMGNNSYSVVNKPELTIDSSTVCVWIECINKREYTRSSLNYILIISNAVWDACKPHACKPQNHKRV